MSLPIALPVGPPRTEDRIASLNRGIDDCTAMCADLGSFLAAAFPEAAVVAGIFSMSLEKYLNHNNREYLETLLNPPPMPPGYMPFDPTEQLVYLCKRRDTLQSQIDSFEAMVESLGSKLGEEGQGIMRAQINLSGIPQQLEDLNEQISNLQRQMETAK